MGKLARWDRWIDLCEARGRSLSRLLIHIEDWDGETEYRGLPIQIIGIPRINPDSDQPL